MNRNIYGVALALTLGLSGLACAEELSGNEVSAFKAAKAAGTLHEGPQGYLQPGSGMNDDLRPIMDKVNAMRREKYRDLANKQGVPLEAVEATAGQKLGAN